MRQPVVFSLKDKPMPVTRSRAPVRITLLYVAFAALWFGVSDLLYFSQTNFPPQLLSVQLVRNLAYVSISTAALYLVLRREFQSRTAAQAQLINILDTAADAIITIDDQQQIQLFNQAAEQLFGYRAAEIIGQPIDCLLPIEARELHRQHIAQFALAPNLSRPMSHQREVIGQRRDGSRFTAEAGISKLDRPGRRSFTVIIRDVTQRQAAETALRASEAQLRVLVEQLPAVLWITDADMRFTFAAGAGLTALKIQPEQAVGQRIEAFSPPDDPGLAEVVTMHQRALQGESVNYESQRRGRVFQNHVEPFRAEGNRISGCLGLALDITDQKRAEAALQESEARYRSIIEAMNEGVVFQDAAGRIQACNPSAERILGLPADQLLGRTSQDTRWQAIREDGSAFPGEEHPATITLQTGQPLTNVVMGLGKPDRSLMWISINAQPLLRAGETTPHAVVVTFADITARKQAEQALQLAETRYRSALEQRVAERTRELAALLDIARNFAATLDIKPLLRFMLSGLKAVVDYSTALTFVVMDDQTALYDVQIEAGDRAPEVLPVIQAAQFEAILNAGRAPLLVPDVTADSSAAQLYRQTVATCLGETAQSLRAWLWVPVLVKGRLIGGLSLAQREAQAFNGHHLELANTIVSLATISIENAQLYAQAQDLATMQERQRLARELHDAVTQQLFSASLIAEVLPQLYEGNPAEGREYLEDIRRLTRGALAEMRALLLELRPTALTESSLADLLRQLADAFTGRLGRPIAIELADQVSPPTDVKVALYRIAQEALNNAAKHAKAQHVLLHLSGDAYTIALRLSDDGRGFDPAVVASDRFGLNIMRERAQAIGAQLAIESGIGRGTSVNVIWTDPTNPR
jgi:PAS domain S-box-containing protein